MGSVAKNRGGGRALAWAAVATAGLVGTVLVGAGVRGEEPPPSPPASAAVPSRDPAGSPEPESQAPAKQSPNAGTGAGAESPPGRAGTRAAEAEPRSSRPTPARRDLVMEASQPTRLVVPAIGVDTDLMNVGLQADGTIGVPPLTPDAPPGWYERGPSPGERGPAVILGHVTALGDQGPAVFFKLGALRQGDAISVTRADGQVAVFTVTRIVQTPKTEFSTLDTYGNTEGAELRLITCGGEFNESTLRHLDNIVVHAELTSTHPA